MSRSRTSSSDLRTAILLCLLALLGQACAHVDVAQGEVFLRVGHESGDFVRVFSEVVILRNGSYVSTLRSGKRKQGRLSTAELSLVSAVVSSQDIPCPTSRPHGNPSASGELVWVELSTQPSVCYYVPGFLTSEMSDYLQALHTVLIRILGSKYDVPLLGEQQP